MATGGNGKNGGGGGDLESIKNILQAMSTQMNAGFKDINDKLDRLTQRVEQNTRGISENKSQINEMIQVASENKDAIAEVRKENKLYQNRITMIENRIRRRNIVLKGIPPEALQGLVLKTEMLVWLRAQTSFDLHQTDLERAHWIFKGSKPRDLIIAFTREALAEDLYKKLRSIKELKFAQNKVWVMRDLAPETIRMRSELREITRVLEAAQQKFSWIFPATLLVWREGRRYLARDLAEGKKMLEKLNLPQNAGDRSLMELPGAVGGADLKESKEQREPMEESRPSSRASEDSDKEYVLFDLDDETIDRLLRSDSKKLSKKERAAQRAALEKIKKEAAAQRQKRREQQERKQGK